MAVTGRKPSVDTVGKISIDDIRESKPVIHGIKLYDKSLLELLYRKDINAENLKRVDAEMYLDTLEGYIILVGNK